MTYDTHKDSWPYTYPNNTKCQEGFGAGFRARGLSLEQRLHRLNLRIKCSVTRP